MVLDGVVARRFEREGTKGIAFSPDGPISSMSVSAPS